MTTKTSESDTATTTEELQADEQQLPKFIIPDDDDADTSDEEDQTASEAEQKPEAEAKPAKADEGDDDKRNVSKKVEAQGYEIANIKKSQAETNELLKKLLEQRAEPEAKTEEGKARQSEQQQETAEDLTESLKGLEDQLRSFGSDQEVIDVGQLRKVLKSMAELMKKPADHAADGDLQKRLDQMEAKANALQQRLDQAEAPKQEQAYFEKNADALNEQYPNLSIDRIRELWQSAKADIKRFKIAGESEQTEFWNDKLTTANEAAKPKGGKAKKADPPKSTNVSRPDESTEGTEISSSGASASVPATQTDNADDDGTIWADPKLRIPKFTT